MDFEELKSRHLEYYSLGGLQPLPANAGNSKTSKGENIVVAILVQIMLSELDGFKRAENLKRRIRYEYPDEHNLRELFDICDTRKQGRLDRFDIFKVGKVMEDNFSIKDARRALSMMDFLEKGFLTFEDFQSYLKPYDILPEAYLGKFDAGENDSYYLLTEREATESPKKRS